MSTLQDGELLTGAVLAINPNPTEERSLAPKLSCRFPGEWKAAYASYYARRFVRRLSAEQLYDAISQSTDVFVEFPIRGLGTDPARPHTMKYAMQARCPDDLPKDVRLMTKQKFVLDQ